MKIDDWDVMRYFIKILYPGSAWEIVLSKKRDKAQPNSENLYRLVVSKDNTIIAESREIKGYRKNHWDAQSVAEFITSLEKV